MKICIDARSPGYSGILNYTKRLMPALLAVAPEHEYVLLRTRSDQPWNFPGVNEIVIPSSNALGWMVWSNTKLPALLRSEKCDVYHTHKHITALRGKTPKAISFHGGRFYIERETYKLPEYAYWRTMAPLATRLYDALIVVSEVDKEIFVRHSKVDPDRFHVVPLAADERFRKIEDRDALEEVRHRYSLPERFVLFVGRMLPVKNVETVVRAFAEVCARGADHDLVMVGKQTKHSDGLKALARQLGVADRIHWTGPIFEEIPQIINLADVFLLASTYEAFATVALEAVACGTPVVGSDRGNIPFIVGEAGRCVPAKDVNAFADAILELLRSDDVRERMSLLGVARGREFSWNRCARGTLGALEAIAWAAC